MTRRVLTFTAPYIDSDGMDASVVKSVLVDTGMISLGAFHPTPDDDVPEGSGVSLQGCTVVLVGNAGPEMWDVFSASEIYLDGKRDPLDRWTRAVLTTASRKLCDHFQRRVTVCFPFEGPPYYPFQKWAVRAGRVSPTPIGPMIDPEYGLWHGYRGAFIIPEHLELAKPANKQNPCQDCDDKPCLTTCPVGAFSTNGYDVPACARHLSQDEEGSCFRQGCLARSACPVGHAYRYQEPQARFHMGKFLAAHRP